MELKKRGQSCRCIRCREVRDWPETADHLRIRVREYRSSQGTEFFITVAGQVLDGQAKNHPEIVISAYLAR